jgi:serine/threonine-protein kinase PknK
MGGMRVRGELVEIDGSALRFDMYEARDFLVLLGGLALDDADVANLERTTDGLARRAATGIAIVAGLR